MLGNAAILQRHIAWQLRHVFSKSNCQYLRQAAEREACPSRGSRLVGFSFSFEVSSAFVSVTSSLNSISSFEV